MFWQFTNCRVSLTWSLNYNCIWPVIDRDDRDRERESVFRIRDRRWLDNALREEMTLSRLEKDRTDGLLSSAASENAKKMAAAAAAMPPSPLSFGEELQFWPEKDGNPAR